MRLSLNGWPPLASHTTAFLLGISVVGLCAKGAPPPLHLGQVTIALPERALEGALDIHPGDALLLVKRRQSTGQVLCRLGLTPATLLQEKPQALISLPLKPALALLTELTKADGTPSVTKATGLRSWPPCAHTPKVDYGKDR